MGASDDDETGPPRRSGRPSKQPNFFQENKGTPPTPEQEKLDQEHETYTQKMSDVSRAIARARLDVMYKGCTGRTYIAPSNYVSGQTGLFANKCLHTGTEIAILGDAVPVMETEKQAAREYTKLRRIKMPNGSSAYQEFVRRPQLDTERSKKMYDNGWAANDGERSPNDMEAKTEAENTCNAVIVEAKSFDNRVVTFLMASKDIPRNQEILVPYGDGFWDMHGKGKKPPAAGSAQPAGGPSQASGKGVQKFDLTQSSEDDAQPPGGTGGAGGGSIAWDDIEEWRDEGNTPQKLEATWREIDASDAFIACTDTNIIFRSLSKQDFVTLKPHQDIGDGVIDCWFDYWEDKLKAWKSQAPFDKYMIVKSMYWQCISGNTQYDALESDIKTRLQLLNVTSVFELDRIIIPVHVTDPDHWFVANVIITSQLNHTYHVRIQFYDSSASGSSYKTCHDAIVNWLDAIREEEDENGPTSLLRYDECEDVKTPSPVQSVNDCAIFTGVNAALLSVGLPLTHFNQSSASRFRTWFTCLIWKSFHENGPPVFEKQAITPDQEERRARKRTKYKPQTSVQKVDLTADALYLPEKSPYVLDSSHTYAMPDQLVTYRIPDQLHRSMYLLKL